MSEFQGQGEKRSIRREDKAKDRRRWSGGESYIQKKRTQRHAATAERKKNKHKGRALEGEDW